LTTGVLLLGDMRRHCSVPHRPSTVLYVVNSISGSEGAEAAANPIRGLRMFHLLLSSPAHIKGILLARQSALCGLALVEVACASSTHGVRCSDSGCSAHRGPTQRT